MDIVNPNYLNYMEQIQKNRKDIEKLYDEELSDITQLNFKEDEENGLEYENGKATFYGKSTIIRDENTENLEVDSQVELKISSGDDDIVIDAGEDNSTLEIHLDNDTRNKINRALLTPISSPSQREFVAVDTNNSQIMIPESEINSKINKKELLYNINNSINVSDSVLNTLDEYIDLFYQDVTVNYRFVCGAQQTSNLKNLLKPLGTNVSNYAIAQVKLYSTPHYGNNQMLCFEIIAIGEYTTKVAKCYLYRDHSNTAVCTDWQFI